MQRLLPDPGPTDINSELDEYRPFDHPLDDRPYVAVNMVASIDGRASLEGRTVGLGTDTDIELLLKLRHRFDAVMIGAGTMRAERYGRIIRDPDARARRERIGLPHDPLAVLISGRLDLPFDAPLFTDGGGRVLIFTNQEGPFPETATPTRYVTVEGPIRITEVLRYLRQERGIRALLSEGGPHVLGQIAASGSFDDLFITTTSVMTGEQDPPRILEGALPEPIDLRLVRLLEDEGELFARYCLRR
jgi:riboflavin biosynthesis pyrimidine reductase